MILIYYITNLFLEVINYISVQQPFMSNRLTFLEKLARWLHCIEKDFRWPDL